VKVAVMGAGAVGAYFGALLHRGGVDVTLIARGQHLEAIKARGLHIKSYQGEFSVPAKAVGDPKEIGPADLPVSSHHPGGNRHPVASERGG
jgi:2-dehydropantoate 2-reductase